MLSRCLGFASWSRRPGRKHLSVWEHSVSTKPGALENGCGSFRTANLSRVRPDAGIKGSREPHVRGMKAVTGRKPCKKLRAACVSARGKTAWQAPPRNDYPGCHAPIVCGTTCAGRYGSAPSEDAWSPSKDLTQRAQRPQRTLRKLCVSLRPRRSPRRGFDFFTASHSRSSVSLASLSRRDAYPMARVWRMPGGHLSDSRCHTAGE